MPLSPFSCAYVKCLGMLYVCSTWADYTCRYFGCRSIDPDPCILVKFYTVLRRGKLFDLNPLSSYVLKRCSFVPIEQSRV